MNSDNWNRDRIGALLRALVQSGSFDEVLGIALADEVEADARKEVISPSLKERMRESVERGMFDGGIARGRARMQGTLGGFGSALRRVRQAAGVSAAQMATRAGLALDLWEKLEAHRDSVSELGIPELASVVEAAQLRLSEVAETLRRNRRLHVVPGGPASFRAEEGAGSDSMAAYEDLLGAIGEDQRQPLEETADENALEEILDALGEELRRRGREDLL